MRRSAEDCPGKTGHPGIPDTSTIPDLDGHCRLSLQEPGSIVVGGSHAWYVHVCTGKTGDTSKGGVK